MPAENPKVSILIDSIQRTVGNLQDKGCKKSAVVPVALPSTAVDRSNPHHDEYLGKWMHGLEQGLEHTDPLISPSTAINLRDSKMLQTTGLQLALMARMVEQAWILHGKKGFPAERINLVEDMEQVLNFPTTYLGDRAPTLLAFFRSIEPIAKPVSPQRVEDPQQPDHLYDVPQLRGLLDRCALFYRHTDELEQIRAAGFTAAKGQIRDRLMGRGLPYDQADYLAYYTSLNASLSRAAAEEMLKDTFRVNKEMERVIFRPFGTVIEICAYEILSRQGQLHPYQFNFSRALTGINPLPIPWEDIYRHPLMRGIAA